MNIYKVRARSKLYQVRADIADLPNDDTTTLALRGIAEVLELVLAEPDRRADADNDPDTNTEADTFVRRIRATRDLLAENGYKTLYYNEGEQRLELECGAKLTFFTSGKALVQGKCEAVARGEIVGLLRADGWAVK